MKIVSLALFSLIFILIFQTSFVSALIINEIMYNPNQCNDDYCEWIELYNPFNETINLTGWKISDRNSNNLSQEYNRTIIFFDQTILGPYDFFIIAKNKENFSYYWDVSCPIAQSNFILNNGPEIIRIYSNNGSLEDEVYYNSSFGGNGDGNSIQRINSTSWCAAAPTPGMVNNCSQQEPPQQQESSIEITDAPDDAKFGEEIDIELEMYRGNTSKYAVYIYVEKEDGEDVSDKETLHLDEKFTNYTEQVTLTLDCENESGNYIIVAEGLNERAEREIELDACHENQEENQSTENPGESEGTTIGDFTYALTIPNTIFLEQEFPVQVKITSQSEQEQEFLIWSYVYIASKCYSCSTEETRESNAKSVIVSPGSFADVELKNIVQEVSGAIARDYKLKIKVLQQGLKTPKEFTYNITLEANNQQSIQQTSSTQPIQTPQQTSSVSSYSTYSQEVESESFSLVKFMPYVLTSVALLAAIYLIITKI